jgi:hypothetical protein
MRMRTLLVAILLVLARSSVAGGEANTMRIRLTFDGINYLRETEYPLACMQSFMMPSSMLLGPRSV